MTEIEVQQLVYGISRRVALVDDLVLALQEQMRLVLDDVRRAAAKAGVRENSPALYRPLPPPPYLATDAQERERKYRDHLDRLREDEKIVPPIADPVAETLCQAVGEVNSPHFGPEDE